VKRRLPLPGSRQQAGDGDRGFHANNEGKERNRDFVGRPLAEKEREARPPMSEVPANSEVSMSEPLDEEVLLEEAATTEASEDEATHLRPAEVEQLVADAFQRGKQQGLDQGREQMKRDFDAAITVVLNIGQELDSLRQTILENSRDELQNLALAIAEKVTRRSVREQSETISRTVEEAVRLAISSEEITVLVNPADYQTIMEKSDELKSGVTGLRAVSIRADDTVEQGGCRLESENCLVDATLAGQLADIALHLQTQS
jgi:flagellar assembly protein FliH